MQTTTYMSADERTASLPKTFSVQQAAQMFAPMTAESLQVLLYRWKKKQMVEPVGLRTGVYVNLTKVRSPEQLYKARIQGLLDVYPKAMVGGITALIDAGLIKHPASQNEDARNMLSDEQQMHYDAVIPKITRPEIAVIKREGGQAGEGPHLIYFDRIPQTTRWFQEQKVLAQEIDGALKKSPNVPGLLSLNGYGVLAELVRSGSDADLDTYPWDHDQFDRDKFIAASHILGVGRDATERALKTVFNDKTIDHRASMSA